MDNFFLEITGLNPPYPWWFYLYVPFFVVAITAYGAAALRCALHELKMLVYVEPEDEDPEYEDWEVNSEKWSIEAFDKEFPPGSLTINSSADVATYFGIPGAAWHQVEKAVYKGTDCGAWLEFDYASEENGGSYLFVGSIVEGAEVDCDTISLKLPTTGAALAEALDCVDTQATEIWKQHNE